MSTWAPLLRGLFAFILTFVAPAAAVIWMAFRDEKKKKKVRK